MMFWLTARIRLFLFYQAMAWASLFDPAGTADLIERAVRQKQTDDKKKLVSALTSQCTKIVP